MDVLVIAPGQQDRVRVIALRGAFEGSNQGLRLPRRHPKRDKVSEHYRLEH